MIADYLKCFSNAFDQLEIGQKRLLIRGLIKEVIVKGRADSQVVFTIPLEPFWPQSQQPNPDAKKGSFLNGNCPPGDLGLPPLTGVPPGSPICTIWGG